MQVIFDIGISHCGDVDKAKYIIDLIPQFYPEAWVKLQYYDPKRLFADDDPRQEQSAQWALQWHEIETLVDHAVEKNVGIGVTVFNKDDVQKVLTLSLTVAFFKIASPDCLDFEMIDAYLDTNRRLIISTGGTSLSELYKLQTHIKNSGVVLMACAAQYPGRVTDHALRLEAVKENAESDQYLTGISSHWNEDTSEIELACLLKMDFFEMHITPVGKDAPQHPDSCVSWPATPDTLKLIKAAASGNFDDSTPTADENHYARRYVHLEKPLEKGTPLRKASISDKRLMPGLLPSKFIPWYKFNGIVQDLCASRNLGVGFIRLEDLYLGEL